MSQNLMVQMLRSAKKSAYAVPAFNILNHITARSVTDACEEARSPVILQTSVATVKQAGVAPIAEYMLPLVKNAGIPVALHLDHCRDAKLAKQCVDAGWTSVMVDYSHLSLRDNIEATAKIVKYAAKRGIAVEGELGAIPAVEDSAAQTRLPTPEEALTFVEETGIDFFAPAIGTAHGFYTTAPKIDFALFKKLSGSIAVPLVIHGGTGLGETVFKKLAGLGAAKINISSALKAAYLDGAENYFSETPKRNPLELDAAIVLSVKKMTKLHLEIFGSAGRA